MGNLSGVRVVDFSQHGPAARASRVLADYGAEVIKIVRPRHRRVGEIDTPTNAYGGGRGLHSVAIDLQHDRGRDLALRILATADVVLDAFRPGVADRLGIGYETVNAQNPGVVYCSISGYGQTGPRSSWVGHDLNYQAVTGLLDRTQPRSDGGPPVIGATIADGAGGGMHAVIAVLSALLARYSSGVGTRLDVSTADGVLWLMSVQIEQHLDGGLDAGPVRLLNGDFACYRTYRCADDRWLSIGALEHRFWANLCHALNLGHLVDLQEVDDRQPEAIAEIEAVLIRRGRDEWMESLAGLDTCVAPVLSVDEVVSDPHLATRGLFDGGRLGAVLAGADRNDVVEHLDVWRELRLTDAERSELEGSGVIEGAST